MAASLPVRQIEGGNVVFEQHFTSGPSNAVAHRQNNNDDVDTIAIEKQEEWIKKRKVEQVTTKQIETRVKRQVVVTEDGQVVDDSGPQVTTRTTEDTETKREEHTEKTGGDEDGTVALPPEGWVAIPGAVIVREKHEKKSNTRDEIDERLETEEVHHLGHLTHQELEEALERQRETGQSLTWRRGSSSSGSESGGRQLVAPYSTGKRVIHQSRKHKRIIDQENTEERSEEKDGRITTETKRHEHHEEIDDDERPDDDQPASDTSSIHEVVKETRNNYTTVQDDDQVEYLAVPKGGHVSAGVKLGHGPRQTTHKTVQYDHQQLLPDEDQVDSAPNITTGQQQQHQIPVPQTTTTTVNASKLVTQPVPPAEEIGAAERTDALTKKPLDLEAEEETRKLETSRWLESHFGSESSSHGSTDGGSANGGRSSKKPSAGSKKKNNIDAKMPSQVSSGGINVTMTSDPSGSDRYDPNNGYASAPVVEPRIYATTGRLVGGGQRYGGSPPSNDKRYGFGGSPPQSPTYKSSTSGYQSALPNGKPELYRNLSAESPVKRAASFNQSAGSGNYSWMNKEELRAHQSSVHARQSFLSSMSPPDKYRSSLQEEPPLYATPIQKRWPPPPKPIDDDEDDADNVRTSTPVYQNPDQPRKPSRSGGTIIRLGPTPVNCSLNSSSSNNNNNSARKNSGSGIARTQSLFHPSSSLTSSSKKMETNNDRYYSNHSSSNNISNNNNNTSRMNMLNSSLQSVPERENRSNTRFSPSRGGLFVDTERSFQSLNPHNSSNPKVIQAYSIKTPPPRPAPPSVNHYSSSSLLSSSTMNHHSVSSKLRGTESFRLPRSAPMFSDELTSPPVRPVRRKSKRTPKTDSGTQCNPQTIRNELIQQQQQQHQMYQSQTLDRPNKPMKKYYLGEDPFNNNNKVVNGESVHLAPMVQLETRRGSTPGRVDITRSQTLPRQPNKPTVVLQSESSSRFNNSSSLNNTTTTTANLSSSRIFSDQDRSLNETMGGVNPPQTHRTTRVIPITPIKSSATTATSVNATPTAANLSASTTTTTSSSVNRSQSFHVENQSATGQRRTSLLATTPLRSVSIRASNSPLYKSTSFLNRTNDHHQPFGTLKSPGIVTSISKSQLDLNKSSTELNTLDQNNSALYTLPRRRSSAKNTPVPVTSPTEKQQTEPLASVAGKVQSGISERLAQLSPTTTPSTPPNFTSPISPDNSGTRGESYSSLHRKRMQSASANTTATPSVPPPPPPPQPDSLFAKVGQDVSNGSLSFQSSTKATHRSYNRSGSANETIKEENETERVAGRIIEQLQQKSAPAAATAPEAEVVEPEARSLKDRIALLESAGIHYANPAQTLPRVVGGKTKAPPPPPPPRVSSSLHNPKKLTDVDPARTQKEGSPEVESIEKRQKFLEGLLNSAPELFMHIHGDENLKDIRVNREDVIDGKSGRLPRSPSPSAPSPAFNNRVYTSTPSNPPKLNTSFGADSAPLTPPPLLIRNNSGGSPFGSQRDLALRRGSLNSTGSSNIIPAVKIPAPVNYSETVRIKSNQDPDSQSDSVQSYSKRVQPFVDGFSSETKLSSQQTTLTRSQYTDRRGSNDSSGISSPFSIRPQQSGGVIIQVRGSGQ